MALKATLYPMQHIPWWSCKGNMRVDSKLEECKLMSLWHARGVSPRRASRSLVACDTQRSCHMHFMSFIWTVKSQSSQINKVMPSRRYKICCVYIQAWPSKQSRSLGPTCVKNSGMHPGCVGKCICSILFNVSHACGVVNCRSGEQSPA